MSQPLSDQLAEAVAQQRTPQGEAYYRELFAQESKQAFSKALEQLLAQGLVLRNKRGKLQTPRQAGFVRGKLEGTAREFSFVREGDITLFVPARAKGDALHGDLVLARQVRPAQEGGQPEGEVLSVVARGPARLLGTCYRMGGADYLAPDDRRYQTDFLITGGVSGAQQGDKCYAEIRRWPKAGVMPACVLIEAIGPAQEFSVNYRAILLQHGIETAFEEDALQQAQLQLRRGVTGQDVAGRLDLRDTLTFTVDGADAKDFDDALSLAELPDGRLQLGVHIADVSHYVREGDAIDRAAHARGTSVYFTDQVVPMLPKELSDTLCSLLPGEDRLTLSCLMTLDGADVVAVEVHKSVIRSDCRCIYAELNRLLEGSGTVDLARKYETVLPAVTKLCALAEKLLALRRARGAMTFETIEPKVLVDADGNPTELLVLPRGSTERMVEECMLAANTAIARYLQQHNLPGVFRVHAAPPPDKLTDLAVALRGFGISLPVKDGTVNPHELQAVADQAAGSPLGQTVTNLLIRSMSRATYSGHNMGHYGLAARDYLHFTSPIRRYPDLLVHRALGMHLAGDANGLRRLKGVAEQLAADSHAAEERAVAAERDILSMYLCLYLRNRIGETFDVVVTGVTSFGLFVTLLSVIEGLIHISDLGDDYFAFDAATRTLRGTKGGTLYQLGHQMRATLVKSDPISRRIDLIPSV